MGVLLLAVSERGRTTSQRPSSSFRERPSSNPHQQFKTIRPTQQNWEHPEIGLNKVNHQ